MSNRFPNGDYDDGWTWLVCTGWATVVQLLLITLCFIARARNVQSMAVFLVYLYLPGSIVAAGASLPMSAPAGWILLLFSFAFYSVVFGSLFYFGHRYLHYLRSFEVNRPCQPVSEPEPETRDEQVETSTTVPEGDREELSDTAAEESAEAQDEAEIPAESEAAADPPGSRGSRWLRCVIGVTAVQPALLLLCLVAPDSLLAAGVMTYFYLPARLLVDGFGLPAPVVLPLFLLSVVLFSVFFGTVVYFGGPLVKGISRLASAFKRRLGRQGKKSSVFPNIDYEGKMKWGCSVSVLIVLQPLLHLFGLLHLADGDVLGSLYEQYVCKPAEWLIPVSPQHYTGTKLLPVFLFMLLVVGTFYSVLFSSLFFWLHRLFLCCILKLPSRKAGRK